MLHPTKSQSILQWFNALTTNVNVEELSQFADGSLFCDIVSSIYAQAEIENPVPRFTLEDCSIREESILPEGPVLDKTTTQEGQDIDVKDVSMEEIDVGKGDELPGSIDVETSTAQIKKEIEKKYVKIENCIDTFFRIQSSTLVSYVECMSGNDLELAKVAVMLLSAMVQNFLSSNNELLATITHLEMGVQEDIKECLSLLLTRKTEEPLTKAEMHKVLGKATKYKATPRRKTSHRGTPVQGKASNKKQNERVATIMFEDIDDSPLKGLLQSPNNSQHRIAVDRFKKETELIKFRRAFHAEEEKVSNLIMENRNLSEDLTKKREELEHLKLEFRQFRETTEEKEGLASMERANLLSDLEKIKEQLIEKDDEIKTLNTERANLETRIFDLENKLAASQRDPGDTDMVAEAMRQMREMEAEHLCEVQELQECRTKIETLSADLKTYKQLYEEGLIAKSEGPARPAVDTPTRMPEIVSNIYTADFEEKLKELQKENEAKKEKLKADLEEMNEKLQEDLKASEEKIKKFEDEALKSKRLVSSLRSQLKEKTDNMKALFDKMSMLQEENDKLLSKAKTCPTCKVDESIAKKQENGVVSDSPVSPHGSLWNGVGTRESVHQTRSRSSNSVTSSAPTNPIVPRPISVNPMTLEKFKIIFRQFCKLLQRLKIIEDETLLQENATQSRDVSTIDDVVQSFEKTVSVLKKVLPRYSQDMRALQESARNSNNNQALLDLKKDNDIMAAEFKVKAFQEKLRYTKAAAETKIDSLKAQIAKKEQECEAAKQKLNEEKKNIVKRYQDLKQRLRNEEAKPCDRCKVMERRLRDSAVTIQNLQQNEDNLKLTHLTLEDKVHKLEEKIDSLEKKNKNLKEKVEYRAAYERNPPLLMDIMSRNYQKLGESLSKQERERAQLENGSGPVISVNTYILPTEQKKNNLNQSIASNFGNLSRKHAYLEVDDEPSFVLNNGSIFEIQNGLPETPNANRRAELERRNTLLPSHLQSAYAVETQMMTPIEPRYSMAPPRNSIAPPRRDDESRRNTLIGAGAIKRKTSEIETSRPTPSKRRLVGIMGKSSRPMAKPTTPKDKTSLAARASFKTPNSIRRLMNIRSSSRKSKVQ